MGRVVDEVLHLGMLEGADRVAVYELDRDWTWSELRVAIEQSAAHLRDLGIRPCDRIQVLADDSIKHHVLWLACAEIGSILVPLNVRYTNTEVERAVGLTEPSIALVQESLLSRFDGAGGAVDPESFSLGGLRVLRFRQPEELAHSLARTPWLITLTSGTSGPPKPVLFSLEGELACARMFGRTWRLNAADTLLGALPFAWIYGLSSVHLSGLMAGSAMSIVPRFSPALIGKAMERVAVTVLFGTTTQFRIMLEHGRQTGQRLETASLRMSVSGGERRNEGMFARFERESGSPVYDLYASSEVRPICGYDPVVTASPRPGKCGRVMPGVDVELRRDRIADRSASILWARSPGNYMGYFTTPRIVDPEVTPGDWVCIGDEFRIDDEGFGQVLDRQTSIIIRGGVNISPAEVEQAILAHVAIFDAVVAGVPDDKFGEQVVAGVVVEPGHSFDATELDGHCRSLMSDYKVPTRWVMLAELPRTANDKVDRLTFGAQVAADMQASPHKATSSRAPAERVSSDIRDNQDDHQEEEA